MRALLATTNEHKARELRGMLGFPVDAQAVEVDETGDTFAANALLKAHAAADLAPAGTIALGEDSGIAVVALNGEPGIRSAPFTATRASRMPSASRKGSTRSPNRFSGASWAMPRSIRRCVQ